MSRGSAIGAAKATAARLAKLRAGIPLGAGPRKVIPLQRVFVPPQRLLGRAVMALFLGPLTADQLAKRCGVDLEELADVAALLRPHAEALRIGEGWLVFGRWESWSAVHEARASLIGEERRCA